MLIMPAFGTRETHALPGRGAYEENRFLSGLAARRGMTRDLDGFLQTALVQEVLPIQRIPLRGPESRVANDAAQLFFGRAIRHTRGSYYVFFEHHRAYVVAAEAQAHLADFEALRDPARLHVEEVREIEARDGEDFQVFDGGGFVPVAAA